MLDGSKDGTVGLEGGDACDHLGALLIYPLLWVCSNLVEGIHYRCGYVRLDSMAIHVSTLHVGFNTCLYSSGNQRFSSSSMNAHVAS